MSRLENIYTYKSGTARAQVQLNTSVTTAQNEPILNQTMNRSICELMFNNESLDQLNKLIFSEMNIHEYIEGMTYNVGDLVWYKDFNGTTYLLRCIKQNNSQVPDTSGIPKNSYSRQGNDRLNESGWDNQNKNVDILDYGIINLLSAEAQSIMQKHEDDIDIRMHPFGKISTDPDSPHYLQNKLLLSDMSNLNPERPTVFFPQTVIRLKSGTAVITGYQRDFGKVVEYDIILKLAASFTTSHTSLFDDVRPLSANNASFSLFTGISQTSLDFQNNKNYFSAVADMNIFSPDGNKSSKCGLIEQYGRNDYVNTYSAKIVFPRPFSDLDYMIFSNTVLSQTLGSNTLVPSANDISYCDKTRQSITLLNITFPDSSKYGEAGYNSQNGGLAANSFHLKVIGQIGA